MTHFSKELKEAHRYDVMELQHHIGEGCWQSFGLILPHVKLGVFCHLPRGGKPLENL